MAKIHHFVNLVGWKEIHDEIKMDFDKHTHFCYCDSISFRLTAWLFGFNLDLRSGMGSCQEFKSIEFRKKVVLLGNQGTIHDTIQLPYLATASDIKDYGRELVLSAEKNVVLLGISSPKQNQLATVISEKNVVSDIYCFGAAVYEEFSVSSKTPYFFRFLISKPERTIKKLILTFAELTSILLTGRRKEFKEFLKLF